MRRPLVLGLTFLTLTALYLWGPARDDMSAVTACVVLLHLGLGLLLLLPVALALLTAGKRARRAGRAALRRILLLSLLAGACALTGLALAMRAVAGLSTAHSLNTWNLHITAGFAALALLALHRRSSSAPPLAPPSSSSRQAGFLRLSLLVGTVALGAATALADYAPEDYYRDLTATNAAQAQNPLFPAGVRFADPADREEAASLPAAYCGRAGCHVATYREWLASAHHCAGTDPFYQQTATDYAAHAGAEAARWCAGCHTPTPGALIAHKPDAVREGVSCVSCHAITGTPNRFGNGHFSLATPQTYPFAEQERGWQRQLHDFLLRVRPAPHQRAYLKPALHRSPEFCADCHRQSFNVPQNRYQFVQGPDPYGEWQNSPFSGRSTRPAGFAFASRQTCQDCHFPRDAAGHVAHMAPGGNTTLPALRGDTAQFARTEAFLNQGRITLDLFALRHGQPGSPREEVGYAPLEAPLQPYQLQPGETVVLDIVVGNQAVGHSFPAGYQDIEDAWLEVTLSDAHDRLLLASGVLQSGASELPPSTHAYRFIPLDRAGRALTHHDLTQQVTTAYRRAIAAGDFDIARYRFEVPRLDSRGEPIQGPLRLHARLRYRPLRPDFARWVLDATDAAVPPLPTVPDPRHAANQTQGRSARNGPLPALSDLPITTLAEAAVLLPVEPLQKSSPVTRKSPLAGPTPSAAPPGYASTSSLEYPSQTSELARPDTAQRFVDYGLGLLAPKSAPELARALRAFHMAHDLAPDRPEPLLGLGRAYLIEPELLAARTQFEAALQKAPGNPIARAYLGVVTSKQGEYDRAIVLFQSLSLQFPEDGALQFDMGLARFRLGNYEEAATAFRRALAADPNDAAAHFQLKLCYQHLQRVPEARREEAILRYLAEDELVHTLPPEYFRQHPEERNVAQPIPEYPLRPPPGNRSHHTDSIKE